MFLSFFVVLFTEKISFIRYCIDFLFISPHIHGLAIYICLVISAFYTHRTSLNNLKRAIKEKSELNAKEMNITLLFTRKNVKQINSIMGPTLILCFLNFYLFPLSAIYFLSRLNSTVTTITVISMATPTILLVATIILIDRLNSALNSIRNDILERVLMNQKRKRVMNHDLFLFEMLGDNNLFTMTAMDVF